MNDVLKIQHDEIVLAVAKESEFIGAKEIKADISGYSKPDVISGGYFGDFIPDITFMLNGVFHIIEVETYSEINSEHTRKQLKTFDDFASKNDFEFILCVPRDTFKDANSLKEKEGLVNMKVEER